MRIIFLPIVLLLMSCVYTVADDQASGYLIVDFYSFDEGSRKDYWLAVDNGERIIHLHTKNAVHNIPAGNYVLRHVDRIRNLWARHDDLVLDDVGVSKFTVRADSINYIGLIAIESTGRRSSYELSFRTGGGLLQRACEQEPGIFEEYAISYALSSVNGAADFKFNCESNSIE